jgi:hypothetical protein
MQTMLEKQFKYGNIPSMNDFTIMIFGYYIHFFGSVAFIGVQCLIPSAPCNFERLCISNFDCPNCFNKVVILFKACPCTLCGMNPTPYVGISMMPNKISEAKRTNKGYLTYSICCTWASSSSHFNSAFFFTQSRAFFSFHFCFACGLLKI